MWEVSELIVHMAIVNFWFNVYCTNYIAIHVLRFPCSIIELLICSCTYFIHTYTFNIKPGNHVCS